MKKYLSLLFILFQLSTNLFAQYSETDSTTSHLQMEKGIALYDQGRYDEALAIYNSISECDPNYWWAGYETALLYYNQDKLGAALAKCQESEDLNPNNIGTMSLKGSILDDMGRTQEAIVYLENALAGRPYNRNLLFNLAGCYLNANELEKAEATIIRNIRINPYHRSSHLLLAKVNFYMGRIAQAYLAYNMAILLNPQVSYINEFEKAITGKLDSLSRPFDYPYPPGVDHRNWDECSWLMKSELAFNTDYEYNYKINYLTARQSFMLFNKLNFSSSDTSIYSQLYARFFKDMMQKNYFDRFLYYSYKNTDNQAVKDWFKENTAKNDEFVQWAQSEIDSWKCYGFSTFNEAENVKTYHFDDNGRLTSLGNKKTVPEESKYGIWTVINDDGWIEQRGPYVDNKLEGDWLVYWSNGQIKQQLVFHDDNLDGIIHTFHPNGAKAGIIPFVKGQRMGLDEEYTSSGKLLSSINYQYDEFDGKKINFYYGDGVIHETDYVAGKTDGKITQTWMNGVLRSEVSAKDSLEEGPYHTWYSNAKPESEGNYTAGVETGKWITNYPNGSKKSEGELDDQGKLSGKKTNYYPNGKMESEETSYSNGLLNGTMIYYFEDGTVKSKLIYKENKPVSIEIFDAKGKSLYTANEVNGALNYRTYYPDGILETDGIFKDGERDGKWTIYYPQGSIARLLNYSNGLQTGEQKTYHENGLLNEVYACDSNKITGPYKEYSSTGKLFTTGAFNKDGKKGEWILYFENDSVHSKCFFYNDVMTGRQFYYSPLGKLETEEFFNENGESIRLRLYDQSGHIAMDQKYEYDSVLFTELWPSGKLKVKKLIIDNKPHGIIEQYFPNGQLKSRKPYYYGLANGTSENLDYQGKKELEIPYLLGSLNGEIIGYHAGKLSYKDPYEYGKSNGYYHDYHTNGKTASITMYINDQKHGNSDFYAPDSSFMYRFIYYENFLKAYTYKNASGAFVPEKQVTPATTEVVCYYPNGKISARIALKNGLLHGESLTYFPDGKTMYRKMFKNGDFEGPFKSYYANGKPKEVINFHNDERNGPYALYYENGQKRKTGQYIAGQAYGEWLIYDEAGKLVNTIYYDNDEIYDIK